MASRSGDALGLPQVIGDGAEYVRGHGLISRITGGTVATHAHADGLGSVRLLTDGAGAVVGTQQYDAFGAPRTQAGTRLGFTYTGEQVDAEGGLVYLRARYYDPATGRFLTRDPAARRPGAPCEPACGHYVIKERPVSWVDPTGQARTTRESAELQAGALCEFTGGGPDQDDCGTAALPGVDVHSNGTVGGVRRSVQPVASGQRPDRQADISAFAETWDPAKAGWRQNRKSAPKNGQAALENSTAVKPTSSSRVGVDCANGGNGGHRQTWGRHIPRLRGTLEVILIKI
ncbi:MAG: RHS repeat-associated core domain-containing protein [Dehalococcoidia bacterium]